jgi:hypothetical protein
MTRPRLFALCIAVILLSATVTSAQDLSRYRDYQLGMTLAAVAKQAGLKPSDARVLHQRPDLIEELEWSQDVSGFPAERDTVRRILFSFHGGQLFRIAVSYNWDRTEGMTPDDMIEAISGRYGLATLPATEFGGSDRAPGTTGDKVVAHWEDALYSVDLLRPSFASTFGMILFSRRSGAMARAADVKATRNVKAILDVEVVRMDQLEAPTPAIERRRTQEAERRARQAKARRVNKASFRP